MNIVRTVTNWLGENAESFNKMYLPIVEKINSHISKSKKGESVDYKYDIVNEPLKCTLKVTEKNKTSYVKIKKLTKDQVNKIGENELYLIASIVLKERGSLLGAKYYKYFLANEGGTYVLYAHYSKTLSFGAMVLSEQEVDINELFKTVEFNETV